jgi:hypothetical protein
LTTHEIFTIDHPWSQGKFLVTNFEFGGSFGTSLERDCYEVEVTPNLELLITFGKSLERDWHELYSKFQHKFISVLERANCGQKYLKKAPLKFTMGKLW